jgi:hypothetical protein
MKSIGRLIFLFIFIGIILNAVKTYFYQNDIETIIVQEVYGWYFKLSTYGNGLISIAALLSFLLYNKYFPAYVSFCYVALIILVTIASWNDLGAIIKTPSIFYSPKGAGTFINFGILFFAANTLYFPWLLKLFYYLCFFFLIASIINLGKVGFGAERTEYLYAIRDFTVYLIWVFPYFLLQAENNKLVNALNVLTFLLIFIFVLSTGARAYLLIYAIYFFVKFKQQLQGKFVVMTIIGMVILIAATFFFLSNTGLSKTIAGAFNILSERKSEDTRSSQIIEFLHQYDVGYLFQGVGPMKTWNWSAVGPYEFLDNQFLLLGWWAGLPTLLIYLYFLVRSFFIKSEILIFENIKGIQLIIGLWILACMGLAIYAAISTDLFYYFITLLMGLHLCKFTKIYKPDIEEA